MTATKLGLTVGSRGGAAEGIALILLGQLSLQSSLGLVTAFATPSASVHNVKGSNRVYRTSTAWASTVPFSPPSTTQAADTEDSISFIADAVVCGGGPAGLLSAIMLAETISSDEQQIHLYDRLSEPPAVDDAAVWDDLGRFYTLGVFGRGKRALESLGAWECVEQVSTQVVGSKTWRHGQENATEVLAKDTGRPIVYALPREKLVSALHEHIKTKYPNQIKLHYGYDVEPLDFSYQNGSLVLLEVCQRRSSLSNRTDGDEALCGTRDDETSSVRIATKFLVGADGVSRTVANRMEQVEQEQRSSMNPLRRLVSGRPFRVKRYIDDNQRVYKTIPIQLPTSEWRYDFSYSMSSEKRRFSIVSLPANPNGGYCSVWLMKKEDPLAQADTDPSELRNILDRDFPQFSTILSDKEVTEIAHKPPSNFPFFRYAGPRLHQGERTVILGDSAHSVKPYNGLGVNSAFEDVRILGDVLRSTATVKDAVQEFSRRRAADSKALVTLSRAGDRPGFWGMVRFLVPIMMDAFFHKVAPGLFAPPVPALVHNEKLSFSQVARRKRSDRIGQVLVLSGVTAALVYTSKRLFVSLVRALTVKF